MNKVVLIGRFTRDPDVRYTDSGLSIASFNLAVDRRYKKDSEQSADFINCKAFGKTAEFIEKYFGKGMKIAVDGRIQTGNYTNKDNQKVYTTDVVCENVEFVEKKGEGGQPKETSHEEAGDPDFMNIPDGLEDELPFQ